ncbi:MAG: type II toxin-antitoxin system VapC family toxin [Rhodomicrobium sp.]
MIAIDSSALVAILQNEPDALLFAEAIGGAEAIVVSAVTLFETSMVLAGRVQDETAWRLLDALIGRAKIEIVPFDAGQAAIARAAFHKYGKGRHPAALNFGDCASYALAKSKGAPLLYKGADFAKTDIVSAL